MILYCNFPLNWIMRNALLQHGSNYASLWLLKNTYKTIGNSTNRTQKASKRHYPSFTFFDIFIKQRQMSSEGSRGAPEGPAGASDSPDKHQNQC